MGSTPAFRGRAQERSDCDRERSEGRGRDGT